MSKTVNVLDKEFELYLTEASIRKRIAEVADTMAKDLAGLNPVFLCVLNGSLFFTADLLRELSFPCEVSFTRIVSYEGLRSTGNATMLLDLDQSLAGRHIVILEDIIDTGRTMKELIGKLEVLKPASIRIASLLLKTDALQEDIKADYVGFEVPDLFLIGYGLDYDKKGRMFKDIYILKK